MDPCCKSGKVYLRPRKAGKKWKPVWLSLVPPSSSGVGRLDIQDLGGSTPELPMRRQGLGERKPKVIRLSELLNVLRLPPNAEACPDENMCAFCVETQDRTLVFAAPKDDCSEWVEKLCLSSFQNNVPASNNRPVMEENAIYASAEDVTEFPVLVQRTDAALRCGLQGAYVLHVGREALLLRDSETQIPAQQWRYELLRRYGRDKGTLTIETGRRCDCGPGTLVFESPQAETIFSLIQSTIKRKTTHMAPSAGQALDMEKSSTLNVRSQSPRPRTPELVNVSAIFENKLKTSEDSEASHPAPITLMPLPSVPKQTEPKPVVDNVYADPADCLKPLDPGRVLYVDPACVLPLKPPGNAEPAIAKQHSVYAEVYDRVSSERSAASDEPIYSEPLKEAETQAEKEAEPKTDPFAHLYAQVCKTPKRSPSPRPQEAEPRILQDSDIIYENLGII